MAYYDSIKDALDSCGQYTGLTAGTSMNPLIHEHKDNIIVVKNQGRLKKYDVPVYIDQYGRYVMHRIIKVHSDHYTVVGDNLTTKEYVTDDMIVGKLVGFYKNGKKYVDCDKTLWYKVYSRVWVALYPLRPVYHFYRRCGSFVKRRILKRGK